jgi:hypothetical protein
MIEMEKASQEQNKRMQALTEGTRLVKQKGASPVLLHLSWGSPSNFLVALLMSPADKLTWLNR